MTKRIPSPTPWSQAPDSALKKVRGVCFDIDDTFSSDGKILPEAYEALWNLKRAGFFLVPITGRPAGWCDHIARFWPVDAVVGENGAFTFYLKEGKRGTITTPGTVQNARAQLQDLYQKILTHFPHATLASDQNYREYDLALDFCEDVTPWSDDQIQSLAEFCRKEGAQAKISSIHVNAWFGDYDKERGFRHWLAQASSEPNTSLPAWEEWLFIGDSLNDEPLFQAFEKSLGVANLSRFFSQLKSPPQWITASPGGLGFQEMADRLLKI